VSVAELERGHRFLLTIGSEQLNQLVKGLSKRLMADFDVEKLLIGNSATATVIYNT
jgi:hypothetical protein